jgi:predicted NBD/HSP70 family sugar kinase
MDHIGIDLGGRESQVCVRNGEGVILEEARRATRALGPWLATRSPARVIVETCTEAFRLAAIARQHGRGSRRRGHARPHLGRRTAWVEE